MKKILTLKSLGKIILNHADTYMDTFEEILSYIGYKDQDDYKRCLTIGELKNLPSEELSNMKIAVNIHSMYQDNRLATEDLLEMSIEELDGDTFYLNCYIYINGSLSKDYYRKIAISSRELDDEQTIPLSQILEKALGTTNVDTIKSTFGNSKCGDFLRFGYKQAQEYEYYYFDEYTTESLSSDWISPKNTGNIYINYEFEVNEDESETFTLTYKYGSEVLRQVTYKSGVTVDLTLAPKPAKPGYVFKSWNIRNGLAFTPVTELVMDKNYTVHALLTKEDGSSSREPAQY